MEIPESTKELLLWRAAYAGETDKVEQLLMNGAGFATLRRFWETPLHLAVKNGDHMTVEVLLSHGVSFLNFQDHKGRTALCLAVQSNDEEMVNLLLKNGVEPFIVNDKKESPLHIAVKNKNEEIFELLLDYTKKADQLNLQDKKGRTVLHKAVKSNIKNRRLIRLLDLGADVNIKDDLGCTPLQYARNNKTIFLLLERGADINSQDRLGKTLLHKIINHHQYKSLVEYLISTAGANLFIAEKDGTKPFDILYDKKE